MEPITKQVGDRKFYRAWVRGIEQYFDEATQKQVADICRMPFVHPHVAVMPDAHAGKGSCVGAVIPTRGAIMPAAVGVDIGCGMLAMRIDMRLDTLRENADQFFDTLTNSIPMGRSSWNPAEDCGSWHSEELTPRAVRACWLGHLQGDYESIVLKYPEIRKANALPHLGTLGGGNHFLELSYDEQERVWVVIHSGSRGVGNKIGTTFTKLAQEFCDRHFIPLPNRDLAYLVEGTPLFADYLFALRWAQKFALLNRGLMALRVMTVLGVDEVERVGCHHNYTDMEHHFGENLWITRKGAIRARVDDRGIIPGSMGERTFIVRGKGDRQSFTSASHGAGRVMSRTKAKSEFTTTDLVEQTSGITCRKDQSIIDEIPSAYKPLDGVMEAQSDLVEIEHTLRQVVCCKGV